MQGGEFGNDTGRSDGGAMEEPCGAEETLLPADEYLGTGNAVVSDVCSWGGDAATRAQDEQRRSKGKDLFLWDDWPQIDSFVDLDGNLIGDFDSAFGIGSSCFEDPLWSSFCSPDAQLVPWRHFGDPNLLAAAGESTNPSALLKPSVSVADSASAEPVVFLDQINLLNPISMQQPPSIEETERFPAPSDAHLIFCPFSDMLVPASSAIVLCGDEIASSSTCPGPELVTGAHALRSAMSKRSQDPSRPTPDMILDGMAANPLETYFPPLTAYQQAYQQPELPMNCDSAAQTHQRFPGDDALMNSAPGLQFGPKGRASSQVPGNPRSPLILEAARVKHLGFQRLQEGMDQLDVGTKACIRDALYRLANDVEQRHRVTPSAGGGGGGGGSSSGASQRNEAPAASSVDRSVAQLLLLQKPPPQLQLRRSPRTPRRVTISPAGSKEHAGDGSEMERF